MGLISDVLRFFHLKPQKKVRRGNQGSDYWQRRSKLFYYQIVKSWIDELSPGEWILDVGSKHTPIVKDTAFQRKTMLDLTPFKKEFPGIEQVVADWFEYDMQGKADLVLCLQVLEHLPDDIVGPFARKLLSSGRHVIISVPYEWSEKACVYHLQDPVTIEKLHNWTQQEPVKFHIESRDRRERLVALYKGTA